MRINVKDVFMQGSVWGSLKGDPNIAIGVLGMVDDTLGVSECGNAAIRKTQS